MAGRPIDTCATDAGRLAEIDASKYLIAAVQSVGSDVVKLVEIVADIGRMICEFMVAVESTVDIDPANNRINEIHRSI